MPAITDIASVQTTLLCLLHVIDHPRTAGTSISHQNIALYISNLYKNRIDLHNTNYSKVMVEKSAYCYILKLDIEIVKLTIINW